MADRRRARAGAGRSPLRGALVLALLAVAGFGLGVLAGGLWEEPDLVIGYLAGETEAVPWAGGSQPEVAAGPEEAAPLVAAPSAPPEDAPLGARRRTPPVAAAPPAAPPARKRPPAAEAPEAGSIAVQVGAFAESAAAEQLADSLRAKGYAVYVSPAAAGGGARWRVRVGPHTTREQADRAAERLRREEQLPTWVLSEGG